MTWWLFGMPLHFTRWSRWSGCDLGVVATPSSHWHKVWKFWITTASDYAGTLNSPPTSTINFTSTTTFTSTSTSTTTFTSTTCTTIIYIFAVTSTTTSTVISTALHTITSAATYTASSTLTATSTITAISFQNAIATKITDNRQQTRWWLNQQ